MSLDIWLEVAVDAGGEEPVWVELYSGNYTHNVVPMWEKAGVYDALYNSGGKLAGEIVDALERGIHHMESHPDEYKALNPENGWGSYEGALAFLREVADACKKYPRATIGVWK